MMRIDPNIGNCCIGSRRTNSFGYGRSLFSGKSLGQMNMKRFNLFLMIVLIGRDGVSDHFTIVPQSIIEWKCRCISPVELPSAIRVKYIYISHHSLDSAMTLNL